MFIIVIYIYIRGVVSRGNTRLECFMTKTIVYFFYCGLLRYPKGIPNVWWQFRHKYRSKKEQQNRQEELHRQKKRKIQHTKNCPYQQTNK